LEIKMGNKQPEKKVIIELERRCKFRLEANLTKEDWEELKEYIEKIEIDGSYIIFMMKDDAERNPDSWEDEVEHYESEWK